MNPMRRVCLLLTGRKADSPSPRRGRWIWRIGTIFCFLMFFSVLSALFSLYLFLYTLDLFSNVEKLIQQNPWKLPSRIYARPSSSGDTFSIERSIRQDGLSAATDPLPLKSEPPELLASFYDDRLEDRTYLSLEDTPDPLIECLLAQEDQSFFHHYGVDLKGIARSAWINLREKRIVQGGSTITQQLAKNLFFSQERIWSRKIKETLASIYLESSKSKEQILELYLNSCYMGQDGAINVYGLKQGAWLYFQRTPDRLSLAECAMLVSILPAPNLYDPEKRPDLVKEKRDAVLKKAFEKSIIREEEYRAAIEEPIPARKYPVTGTLDSVGDLVKWDLRNLFGGDELAVKGYSIYTTLSSRCQRAAEKAVSDGIRDLEEEHPELKKTEQSIQASLVCLNGKTGEILAVVGGRNPRQGDYNRAVQARRPIGSLMKPFVYLAAFEQSLEKKKDWTPASIVIDEPLAIKTGAGEWKPENYTQKYLGPVTLRKALEKSINIPAVKISQQIGLDRLVEFLNRTTVFHCYPHPSLPLGTVELTPMEMAQLYTLFLNHGTIRVPYLVKEIQDVNRRVLYRNGGGVQAFSSPLSTFQVLSILKGVLVRGTGSEIGKLGWKGIAAGKTGTTTKYYDAWFVGMTPELVAIVWVGYDRPESVQLTGSRAAMPIWVRFMKDLYPEGNPIEFEEPPGIYKTTVSYDTGKSAKPGDPNAIEEFFVGGSAAPVISSPAELSSSASLPQATKPVGARNEPVKMATPPLKSVPPVSSEKMQRFIRKIFESPN